MPIWLLYEWPNFFFWYLWAISEPGFQPLPNASYIILGFFQFVSSFFPSYLTCLWTFSCSFDGIIRFGTYMHFTSGCSVLSWRMLNMLNIDYFSVVWNEKVWHYWADILSFKSSSCTWSNQSCDIKILAKAGTAESILAFAISSCGLYICICHSCQKRAQAPGEARLRVGACLVLAGGQFLWVLLIDQQQWTQVIRWL